MQNGPLSLLRRKFRIVVRRGQFSFAGEIEQGDPGTFTVHKEGKAYATLPHRSDKEQQ